MKPSLATIMSFLLTLAIAAPMPADSSTTTSPPLRDFDTFDPKESSHFIPAGTGETRGELCARCIAYYYKCLDDYKRYMDGPQICPNRTCMWSQCKTCEVCIMSEDQ